MKTAGIILVTLGAICIMGAIGGTTDVDNPMSSGETLLAIVLGLGLLSPGFVMLYQVQQQVKHEVKVSHEPISKSSRYPSKYPNPKNEDEIRTAFFLLVRKYDGCITLFKFAMETNLPGEVAREFLDKQAKVFNAGFDTDDKGDVVYRFPV